MAARHGDLVDSVTSFKGVPFAAPPVGELRWKAPAPVKPWTGVRKAEAGPPTKQDADEAAQAPAAATPAVAYEYEPLTEPPEPSAYEPEVIKPSATVAPAASPQKADHVADASISATPTPGERP